MSQFQKQLAAFRKKAVTDTDATKRAIILELFGSVVMDTPVREGRARGNWQASFNSPISGETARKDKNGALVINEIIGALKPGDGVWWLTNNLPYIARLEYDGHSKQAPEGMVRKNVSRIESIVKKAAKQSK